MSDDEAEFLNAGWADSRSNGKGSRGGRSDRRILSVKTGVVALVIVNLLLWAYATAKLNAASPVFEDLLRGEYVDARKLPRPDPLDGLEAFLAAAKDG
ncbi:hypothetical protein ONZ51_g1253 [Trametes cubensis]|uniref:Uncharacterized protein n=1 Tax=Trametes cubensis TaxID=1111947 RepID=A0AAD7U366_9APHY|nr:hypothetical protein ONZ51_g1253 [Trametes cubensis]